MNNQLNNVAVFVFNAFTNDSRVEKQVETLVANQFSVTVIAHGMKMLPKLEQRSGYVVERIASISSDNNRPFWGRFFSKVFGYFKYLIVATFKYRNTAILHCHDLNTLPIGYVIKKIINNNAKLIYDAHEFETERFPPLPHLAKKLAEKMEHFLIRHADHVITVSQSIADEYAKRYQVPVPTVIRNLPRKALLESKPDLFRKAFSLDKESIIFLYQGAISPGRGVDLLLNAFVGLKRKDAHLVFLGYGPLAEKVIKTAADHHNIHFHEAVSSQELLAYTASADVGLSIIENHSLSLYYCLPNKLFEYLQAGLPVIVSDLPEIRKVIESNHFGFVIGEKDEAGLIELIEKIDYQQLSEIHSRLLKSQSEFSWEQEQSKLEGIYFHL